ncbi:hypothetical protein CDD82_5728 [Ophiocordyceps australis]|uniref:Protein phosphatase 4 core regulatory subunit R2 n=1 Tax=Ophiocordyceps australis TaxID=1399860 RepID=A0A2C5YZ98_9HYPO|nr:hypothetical protein CDD82_5728 [Ophiocordyceps australis]
MDVDDDGVALQRIAAGGLVREGSWLSLRADLLARLDENARSAFPIPKLPPPAGQPRLASALPSSPLEHSSPQRDDGSDQPSREAVVEETGLPKQIQDMLDGIKTQMSSFTRHAPHTIQRLAELLLEPRAHYKALASYLHAVDRVVHVTSGTTIYPLPPAVPDLSAFDMNGDGDKDEVDVAETVAWSNPTTAALGSDEALGGALLTPIPWLTRRSPETSSEPPGAQIHSEGTETIDGPNGMGSIETVSVSVNGVPSTGHARGITQGELLRQEQRAGVVPVSQLSRNHDAPASNEEQTGMDHDGDRDDEAPHARGPDEIGVNDMGPQGPTRSYVGEDGGVEMQGLDVAAAVGRSQQEDTVARAQDRGSASDEADQAQPTDDSQDSVSRATGGTKREADEGLDGSSPKKIKEDEAADTSSSAQAEAEAAVETDKADEAVERVAEEAADEGA